MDQIHEVVRKVLTDDLGPYEVWVCNVCGTVSGESFTVLQIAGNARDVARKTAIEHAVANQFTVKRS